MERSYKRGSMSGRERGSLRQMMKRRVERGRGKEEGRRKERVYEERIGEK